MQNIQTPTGVTVNPYIYIKNEWEVNESVIDNQSLVVREGGSIKMTLPVSCAPGNEASQVSVTGATDYSFSNDNQYWGHVVLTINNVTPNMNLRIKLAWNDNNFQVKYDYEKEYKTDKKVIGTVTLNDSNDWSHTWAKNELPNQLDGKDCIYTIEEEVPSGYQVSYNNNGILEGDITVTNKKLDSTELPSTGGFGKLGYYAIGALFITTTLLVYIVNLEKKEDSIT